MIIGKPKPRKFLSDTIGQAAMLEQTAEEAMEFAHACLKYARYLRKDNPVSEKYTKETMIININDEAADIDICLDELKHCRIIDEEALAGYKACKIDANPLRFRKRGIDA